MLYETVEYKDGLWFVSDFHLRYFNNYTPVRDRAYASCMGRSDAVTTAARYAEHKEAMYVAAFGTVGV